MTLEKNMRLTLSVSAMNGMGNGVARLSDGFVVFVTGAVLGDTVDATVLKVTKDYAVAKCDRVITPSPDRVPSCCTAKGCGGCAYRLLSYAREKALKEEDVRHAFRKTGLGNVKILPLLSTDKTEGYRNKAQYPVALSRDGRMIAGFYAPHSHRVVEAAACRLQSPAFFPVVSFVTEYCNQNAILPYDEESGAGLLRHIYLRTDKDHEKVLLTLVINGSSLPDEADFIQRLKGACPHVVSLVLNRNEERTNVICGREYRILFGDGMLEDILCGVQLSVSPPAFYQVNHDAAELLYQTGAKMAELRGDETMLDLFCGIGSIGLSMASRVRRLVGIELVPEAVSAARRNAERNGVENASFFTGDATDFLSLLSNAKAEIGDFTPDIVVLDPPRKGCEAALLSDLAHTVAPEKILYISCNPMTLARDAASLQKSGYTVGDVQPVDLFPRTGHCECICLFQRSPYRFRLATDEDAAAVLRLYEDAKGKGFCVWDASYPTERELKGDLAAETLYVLTDADRVIGALSVMPENELDKEAPWQCRGGARELCRIVVSEAHHGQGLALYMVENILAILKERGRSAVHMSVAKANLPAQKTYQKAGFFEVGEAMLYGGEYLLYEKLL